MTSHPSPPELPLAASDALLPAVPLLALDRQNAPLRDEIRAALQRVCDSGRFVLGPDVADLEKELGAILGVPHVIACASGSDALLLALMALEIGPGDEVVLPSYTFFATASAVTRLGATPIFADIDAATYLVDPADVARKMSRRTKAIIPVHLFGRTADMNALAAIARGAGVPIVEDAAQSILSTWDGRCSGALGDVGCFSFYPTKNLGGAGDGGFLTTARDDLAAALYLAENCLVDGVTSKAVTQLAARLGDAAPPGFADVIAAVQADDAEAGVDRTPREDGSAVILDLSGARRSAGFHRLLRADDADRGDRESAHGHAAIAAARLERVVYGASDPTSGGVEHGARVFSHPQAHHRPEVVAGVAEAESAALLKDFFAGRR
jgi:hypothetical protein